MITTQKLGADFRVTVPSSIRRIMGADKGDYVTFNVTEVTKKGDDGDT